MLPLPEEYLSSICEIKTMENEIVATGTIRAITQEYIEISDRSGVMPLAEYEMIVKINVFNSKQGFRVLAGKVYTSSVRFMRIIEVTSLVDYERRHFFRVETNIQAQMMLRRSSWEYRDGKKGYVAEDGSETYIPVVIKNLSLGGALFLSPVLLESGENVILKLKLRHYYTHFSSDIRREEEMPDGRPIYGCIFGEMTEPESDALCAFIFQRQREQIQQKRLGRE